MTLDRLSLGLMDSCYDGSEPAGKILVWDNHEKVPQKLDNAKSSLSPAFKDSE